MKRSLSFKNYSVGKATDLKQYAKLIMQYSGDTSSSEEGDDQGANAGHLAANKNNQLNEIIEEASAETFVSVSLTEESNKRDEEIRA